MTDLFDPVRVSVPFEEFYVANLAWSAGARIKSTDLRAAYMDWAQANRRPSMSLKEIKSAMQRRGHRHLMSNGAWLLDVRILSDEERTATPSLELPPLKQMVLPGDMRNIDNAIASISMLLAVDMRKLERALVTLADLRAKLAP